MHIQAAPYQRPISVFIGSASKIPGEADFVVRLRGYSYGFLRARQRAHRLKSYLSRAHPAAVELTDGDLREIESAASQITVQGARYAESAQRMINR
jgi:hypothetical protein